MAYPGSRCFTPVRLLNLPSWIDWGAMPGAPLAIQHTNIAPKQPSSRESGGCVETVFRSASKPRHRPQGNLPQPAKTHTGQAPVKSHSLPVPGPPGTPALVTPLEFRAARPTTTRPVESTENPASCILNGRQDNLPRPAQGPHQNRKGTKAP